MRINKFYVNKPYDNKIVFLDHVLDPSIFCNIPPASASGAPP